jgi:iron complex outermembrane receptor protein
MRYARFAWVRAGVCAVVWVGSSVVATSAVFAQEEAPPERSAAERRIAREIEEVTITARKLEESLESAPLSVSAFREQDIADRNMTRADDLSSAVPNLKLDRPSRGSTDARIYMRGVGQDDPVLTNDPAVGIYVDGVYLARMQGSLLNLLDIERIEVLRGPQGTLYGRNTIGGAINIITAKPSYELGGSATVRIGSYRLFETRGSVNVPLVAERMALRLSAATATRDGYTKNRLTGTEWDDNKNLAGRAVLRIDPTDSLEVLLAGEISREYEKPQGGECVYTGASQLPLLASLASGGAFDFATTCRNTRPGNEYRFEADIYTNQNELDTGGLSMTVTYGFDDFVLKSITAWRQIETRSGIDADQTRLHYVHEVDRPGDQDGVSQELQLTGSLFENRLRFVSGLYWFRETAELGTVQTILPGLVGTPTPCVFLTGNAALCTAVYGSPFFLLPFPDFGMDGTNEIENLSYAAYGQIDFDLADRLTATFGLRRTHERKQFDRFSFRPIGGSPASPVIDTRESERFDAWTPMAKLRFDVSDDLMVYASYAEGFKSGGFNGRASSAGPSQLSPFDPEQVDSWEVGVKGAFFDRRLTVNAAWFYNDYEDIQLTIFGRAPEGGFLSDIVNAGEATIQGLEVEFVALPLPGLQLSGNVGLIRANYEKFTGRDPATNLPVDRAGLDFKHTPPWTYTLAAAYSLPLEDLGVLTARAEWFSQGRVFQNTENDPTIKQGKYGLLSARLSLLLPDERTEVALFGRNLLDRRYIANAVPLSVSLGFNSIYWNEPRMFGLEVSHRF